MIASRIRLSLLLCFVFMGSIGFGQKSSLADFNCMGEYKLYYVADTLYEYVGSDPTIKTKEITLKSKVITRWVKKKRDNCTETLQNDCMIWCLIESDPYQPVSILQDPNSTDEKQYIIDIISQDGDIAELAEVCKDDITPALLSKISARLHALGYLKQDKSHKKLKGKLKKAWHQFQQDYHLGVGGISEVGVFVLLGE